MEIRDVASDTIPGRMHATGASDSLIVHGQVVESRNREMLASGAFPKGWKFLLGSITMLKVHGQGVEGRNTRGSDQVVREEGAYGSTTDVRFYCNDFRRLFWTKMTMNMTFGM